MLHRIVSRFSLFIVAAVLMQAASAQESARFCVFDPAGKGGELSTLASQYLQEAGPLQLRTYVNERVAAEDFKAGQCDGVVLSTFRARQFNVFTSSVDAFGAVPSTAILKPLFAAFNQPVLASNMVRGPYEVAGMIPLGSLYVLVRDRSIDSVEKAAGRKVAVLDWDKSQARLVQGLAAQPVASDIFTYATRFNNGQVDIIAMPALMFQHFELEKGLGQQGAIYRFPLAQLTSTVLIRRDRFPEGFAARLRAKAPAFVDVSLAHIKMAEAAIPAHYWLNLGEQERQHYQQLLAGARDQLTQDGFYDPRMMALLHRLRCHNDPSSYECAVGIR